MRIVVICMVMLLASQVLPAQVDTTKNKNNSIASKIIADIHLIYDNMEQVIKLEYAKLVKENKRQRDELNEKIKGMDQQIEKLKEMARKLEEIAAKMQGLLEKMMKEIGNDRDRVNQWGKESGRSNRTSHLRSIRDSILQTIPVQTSLRKDSLIRLTQIQH